jgi:telomerase Cajal body protein 1
MVHIYDLQGGQWVTAFQSAAGMCLLSFQMREVSRLCVFLQCIISHIVYLILDTVNGFSFHPYLPFAVTSSGHRRFSLQDESEEELNLAGVCYINFRYCPSNHGCDA